MDVFTEKWLNAVVEKLKGDEIFHKKAEVLFRGKPLLAGDYHFRALKDTDVNLNEDVAFGMRMPSCDPCWFGEKPDYEVDFIIEAKGGVFLDVISGRMHLVEALRMGAQKKPVLGMGHGTTQISPKITGGMGGFSRAIEVIREVSGIEKKAHAINLYGGVKSYGEKGEWEKRNWDWTERDWRPPKTDSAVYGRLEG